MMAKRRIADDELYHHFLTFSVDRRRRLLELDVPKKIMLGVLNYVLEKHDARCQGFVIMPDHVHAVIWLPQTDQLSGLMHEWKRQSSLRIRRWYRDHAPNYEASFGTATRFWQPKYHAFSIETESKLEEKIDYIHLNPVRAGLVARAVDWHWSSARWYYRHQSVGVPIEGLADRS